MQNLQTEENKKIALNAIIMLESIDVKRKNMFDLLMHKLNTDISEIGKKLDAIKNSNKEIEINAKKDQTPCKHIVEDFIVKKKRLQSNDGTKMIILSYTRSHEYREYSSIGRIFRDCLSDIIDNGSQAERENAFKKHLEDLNEAKCVSDKCFEFEFLIWDLKLSKTNRKD